MTPEDTYNQPSPKCYKFYYKNKPVYITTKIA